MYNIYFNSQYFLNFLSSLIFLSVVTLFSLCFADFLKKKKINIFNDSNFLSTYFLIYVIYSVIFNFSIILNLQNYLHILIYFFLIFMLAFSVNFIFKNKRDIKLKIKNLFAQYINDTNIIFLIFVLSIFFLITILPISDADSIAYHLNSIMHLYSYGINQTVDIFKHLEFSLISNSEILLMLSVILKSDNFGSQLNFFSLLVFFFYFINKKRLFLIILLSCPLIIFFISTQKLQLFFALLYLFLFYVVHKRLIKSNLDIFIFIFLSVFYLSGKLSYFLFFIPLYIYFCYLNFNKIKIILLYSVFAFILIQAPILLLKFKVFGNPFSPFLTNIFIQNKDIFDAFSFSLRSSEGWLNNAQNIKLYLLPFFPTNIYKMSASLGLCFLIMLMNFNLLKKLNYIPIICILLVLLTGQISPRYFFECFLILAFFVNQKNKILYFFGISQLIGVLIISSLFVYKSYFDLKVFKDKYDYKKNFSYYYQNSLEVKKLKLEGNILNYSQDRPNIYEDSNLFSSRFLNVKFLKDNNNEKVFLEFIKKNNIKYIIAYEKLDLLSCLDLKNVGVINLSVARRNFLVKKNTSKSYIFKVDNKC